MSCGVYLSRYVLPSVAVTHFSAVWFVTTKGRLLLCTETHGNYSGLSCGPVISEQAQRILRHVLNPQVLVTVHGIARDVMLVDIVQTLVSFRGWQTAYIWDVKCNTYSIFEWAWRARTARKVGSEYAIIGAAEREPCGNRRVVSPENLGVFQPTTHRRRSAPLLCQKWVVRGLINWYVP